MPPNATQPIFDQRQSLHNQPGVHALIVGVSDYPHLAGPNEPTSEQGFRMSKLSSTSLTAFRIYQWLLNNRAKLPVPLKTCRLLLSPSDAERAAEPQLAALVPPNQQHVPFSTLDNFLAAAAAWRADAKDNPANMTLFYFAGHGIERNKGDSILLLEGFGDGIGGALRHGVEVENIVNGMAPAPNQQSIANTQLYFIDACRNLPKAITNYEQQHPTQVFTVQLAGEDRRIAPIFYAAAPGTQAQAVPVDQTLFSKALLNCLDGDAGDIQNFDGQDRWHVSVHRLATALKTKIDDWNATLGANQYFVTGGQAEDSLICYLDGPPSVEVILHVDPGEALEHTHVEVYDEQDTLLTDVPMPLNRNPFRIRCPAGFYAFKASIKPPNPLYTDLPRQRALVLPPRYPRKVKVRR
jgi:hypothetical protein